MTKKHNFPKTFFMGLHLPVTFYFCLLPLPFTFDIVASYHRIQFHEKLMIQTQENCNKTSFWA